MAYSGSSHFNFLMALLEAVFLEFRECPVIVPDTMLLCFFPDEQIIPRVSPLAKYEMRIGCCIVASNFVLSCHKNLATHTI